MTYKEFMSIARRWSKLDLEMPQEPGMVEDDMLDLLHAVLEYDLSIFQLLCQNDKGLARELGVDVEREESAGWMI